MRCKSQNLLIRLGASSHETSISFMNNYIPLRQNSSDSVNPLNIGRSSGNPTTQNINANPAGSTIRQNSDYDQDQEHTWRKFTDRSTPSPA
mmetsp:Transcript_4829/g.10707  ORF Transcript_4829/g.10707 Transcript_4829/m.10707 type:complete len:91 (-) Transcript_4829:208-480(-)